MHVRTVFYFVNDSLLVIFFVFFQTHIDTSQFEGIVEKCTSLDVDNLTYLDGCCLFGFCELKEDSQFTELWFLQEQDRFSSVFLLHST